MSKALNISEAAKVLGVSWPAVYYHVKRRPELFEDGPKGKTITLENLGLIARKRKAPKPNIQPAFRTPPPPAALVSPKPSAAAVVAKPIPNVRVKNVGSWCMKCGDLMPSFRLDCRCLWAEQSAKAMEAHKAEYWRPAYVDIHVTPPRAQKV